ncbi:MAG: 30S ribosomal protein S16 [Saprospiraceae bacterium]|nr:30S ribosomal protein S16 [Saprospiraceae bacterium]MBK8449151.1 30S ribosomal protein S16 [Saprospiraceae bacterium]MBK8484799.1 30S ribosomal protein S16 [Saprospiraceae bacterium]MBK9222191.1 30S ribosomal protein S16 [Saprospiraceae bacterium]MBK9720899.1 30S ribosomal protein S16 [Saprospiraceae bacterium]
MAVKIRLQRKGRKKAPFYHIVIADSRSPRDGRFIEKIGIYNPITKPATVEIDRDKAFEWLMKGAQPTDTLNAILRYKGVLYRKHLSRGVSKGALTQEKADQMYQDWIAAKEGSITQKVEARKQEVTDFHKKMSGEAKVAAPIEVATEEKSASTEEE